jgi:hypothetical protein
MAERVSKDDMRIAGPSAGSLLAALLCITSPLWPVPAAAQKNNATPNFTSDTTTAWFPIGDEFRPPASGPGPVTFDKRYPYIDNGAARRGRTQPTYRIADLTNPILQPWAVERMRMANEEVLAGKVPFRARERCYPAGVPAYLVYTLAEPVYIVQTPKQVTFINQGGPEVRRVYLDVPHSAKVTPSWYGESVGHYEGGDTLVIDTIGLSTKTFVDNYRTPHTDQLHVVERLKLVEDDKFMDISITVEDPGVFTAPWSAGHRYRRAQTASFSEHVCAEYNVDPFGYDILPIPTADKPDF